MIIHISSPKTVDPTNAPADGPAAFDEAVLDDLLRQVGDPDGSLRAELVSSYLAEAADQIASFVTATISHDPATVAAIAHSLRSTSSLLGAGPLADLLDRAEQHALRSPGDIGALGRPVEIEFDRVARALRSSMGGERAGQGALHDV